MTIPTEIGPMNSPASYIMMNNEVAIAISFIFILCPKYAKVTVYKLILEQPHIITER